MNNLYNPAKMRYISVDGAAAKNQFAIAGGAAGWIDTDISGSDIPPSAFAILWWHTLAAGQDSGIRANGVTDDTKVGGATTIKSSISDQSSAQHCDFYREAANATYTAIGYFVNG